MNPTPPQFMVQGVGHFPGQLEMLIRLAQQRGIQSSLIDVIRQMIANLQSRPRDWGDPYVNFRGLHAVRYGKTIMPAVLRVEYTVHDTEPLVWLSAIWALPGSPFA